MSAEFSFVPPPTAAAGTGKAAQAPPRRAAAPDRPSFCTCRRPVLYVEDQPLNVEAMQAVFAYLPDYRLVAAGDGRSALLRAEAEPPALLLLDLGLPDMDGTELLLRLRALPDLARTPAVAVTAAAPHDLLATTSFLDVWTKPLRIARVLQGVERWAGAAARSASPA